MKRQLGNGSEKRVVCVDVNERRKRVVRIRLPLPLLIVGD
jgi:hypothetical protein